LYNERERGDEVVVIEKKVAVVMGGGGAIGRSICLALARDGIRIVVGDVDERVAKTTIEELNSIGLEPFIIIGDLSDKTEVARMKAEVADRFGRADILVNVHGTNKNELLLKMTEGTWRQTMSVHVDGTLNTMLAFAPMMRERKFGRIINMSSIAARGSVGGAAYAAAKSSIEGITRSAALEWARYNITANCLAPGLIGGNSMFMKTTPKEFQDAGIEKTPMKRAGSPDEVAALARFLASEDAGFITGQTIAIDGGLSVGF
jgi:3-oxoacyl-[acyl-carrier protein] reductase